VGWTLEGHVVPVVLTSTSGMALLLAEGEAPKGFMDALPDPMKVDPATLIFVIALVTALFIFLKYMFFKPIIKVMDDRDAAIQSGADRRSEAAALVEQRQAEYQAQLKELRAKAFEHRKSLSTAAAQEKQALLDKARAESSATRTRALEELKAAREKAKADLVAQVESLSESMVSHLLKQA
jgi:F-type H+-transporting ATPase subunit b